MPDSMIVVQTRYVEAAGDELGHDFFQGVFFHLPMADADTQFRVHFADLMRDAFDGAHAVVQVKDLAATVGLGLNRAFDQVGGVAFNNRLDRASIDRRRFDHAHCTGAGERHVQCAWNRSGAEGENVDVGAQLLDALLLAHAEALLFIDHKQAEVLEVDILAQDAMGADDDVDASFCQDSR